MSDDVHWDRLIVEELPKYAYPGEIRRLARIARLFIPPEQELDDGGALGEGIFGLVHALQKAGYGDYVDPASPLIVTAVDAVAYVSSVMLAWREFAELPPEEQARVIAMVL